MLAFQTISLVHFKNYQQRSFTFEAPIIGIHGNNGVGKTNLLDAIYYLCITKSYFTRIETNNVLHGQSGFRLSGDIKRWDKEENAICIVRENGKKEFLLDEEPYEKFSQHIGRYPCVVIAPDDAVLITGDSKMRRTLLDAILCQVDKKYLQNLIAYKRIITQRNALLKSFFETGKKDFTLLTVLDEQLSQYGTDLFESRRTFLQTYLPLVFDFYKIIAATKNGSSQTEDIAFTYVSSLLDMDFANILKMNRQKDYLAQRTTDGIHRDDIQIELNGQPFKAIASQGQRKSLLFALKLAEFEKLKEAQKLAPILLLDDVFEKLDETRIGNLLQLVCKNNEGQVFITDTNKERLMQHIEPLKVPYQMIALS
ncbi:MAG: DNA replication and repair protein RecF [Chitinophagaceae bacterium]|nr:DNA replication and repair protein RecF [Chitinophagaceae bacterium]